MLGLGPHFWSLLAPFWPHFRSMLGLSWRPGPPLVSQVGLLGGLSACKLASWGVVGPPSWLPWPPGPPSWSPGSALGLQVGLLGRILASKLASWASFGPPSWPPGPAFGLQVGLWVWLWASKLASWAALVNRPFEFKFFTHIYLRGPAECAERLNPPPPTCRGTGVLDLSPGTAQI